MEDTAMTNLDPNPTENPPAQTSAQTAEPTIDQLKKQREELERRIAEKQKAGRKDVIDQIVKVMRDFEVPLEDVAEALGGKIKRQGSKAKAKYRDPQSGAEWSGRGKPPVWIKGIEDRTPFEIR
jgi:DNA-binding protein H-NS